MVLCENILSYYPIGYPFPHNIGILKLIIGILYIIMVPIIIFWITKQTILAQKNENINTIKMIIFPVFINLLWLSAFSSFFIGILMLTISINVGSKNSSLAIFLYSLAWTFQHAVIEGIAFMFLQRGCGINAAITSSKLTLVWCIITFGLQLLVYKSSGRAAVNAQIVWSAFMLIFYLIIWLAPQSFIFRRPAAFRYSQFWFWFRLLTVILYIFQEFDDPTLASIGNCGYAFGPLLLFTLIQPFVCYWALLQDSRWWQGLNISQGKKKDFEETLQSPLLGLDIPYTVAQELAQVVDSMSGNKSTPLLNFAHIYLDKNQLLGVGSFSKVFRGKYRGKHCALKLIFTVDLTIETIRRVAAEAALLASVKSPNVVHIFGVSVLPPSVCIVLELCAFGSLADIIHKNRKKGKELTLSKADRLYLGLGCARGLAALHSLNPYVTHRDIKSFNFLVDSQLNAKLADLELGNNSVENNFLVESGSMLMNWIAPEILQGDIYTQASDIYSLGLVLWEIFSGEAPYDTEIQIYGIQKVREQIIEGIRPILPNTCPTIYSDCVKKSWEKHPKDRITASEISTLLVVAWQSCFTDDFHGLTFSSQPLTKMSDFFTSKNGLEFVDELNVQLNALKASETSTISLSTGDSNHGLVLATMKASFLWSTETSLATSRRTNSRGSLYRSRSLCSGDGILDSTTAQLQELYRLFQNNSSWSHLDQVDESVIIVTASRPHVIVKTSTSFISLIGFGAENIFCHCLDHYIDYDTSLFPEEEFHPKEILTTFYDTIALRGLAHMIIQFLNSENQPVRCSVHGFAIGYPNLSRDGGISTNDFRETSYSLNYSEGSFTPQEDGLKGMNSVDETVITSRFDSNSKSGIGGGISGYAISGDERDNANRLSRIPFPFLREEADNDSRSSAFYAIYVNPLQPLQKEESHRSISTSVADRVKRLVSVASTLSFGSGIKLSDLERGPSWSKPYDENGINVGIQ